MKDYIKYSFISRNIFIAVYIHLNTIAWYFSWVRGDYVLIEFYSIKFISNTFLKIQVVFQIFTQKIKILKQWRFSCPANSIKLKWLVHGWRASSISVNKYLVLWGGVKIFKLQISPFFRKLENKINQYNLSFLQFDA